MPDIRTNATAGAMMIQSQSSRPGCDQSMGASFTNDENGGSIVPVSKNTRVQDCSIGMENQDEIFARLVQRI
jgi:hypothetical protein